MLIADKDLIICKAAFIVMSSEDVDKDYSRNHLDKNLG
jgi:hypothetical protein